jgi:hypothetical protein
MKVLSLLWTWPYWILIVGVAMMTLAAWELSRRPKGKRIPGRPTWFLSSLDSGDRKLLLWSVGIALVLAVAIGFLMPSSNNNDNPLPSTYLSGQHGARAAYETLLRSNYPIERWERPLNELAAQAGPQTVLILAQPFTSEISDIKAVRQILERGGRVLATGQVGGFILPSENSAPPDDFTFAACKLEPEGLASLASTGEVWMVPGATWEVGNPTQKVNFSCAGQPAVIEYAWGKGHVVWWAAATPLENGSLARGNDLDLLLNSIGPREGHRFYWDESLHGEIRSTFSYAAGPSWTLLWWGMIGVGILIVFSFSRRNGPVRDLPLPARATPIEFLEALGSLYRNAGAASTAVAIALERFRRQSLRLCGLRGTSVKAADLAEVLRRRFGNFDPALEGDLAACADAAWGETVTPREALRLVVKLHHHMENLQEAARPRMRSGHLDSKHQER